MGEFLLLVILVRKFLSLLLGPKSTFGDKNKGLNIILDFSNPKKAHPCLELRLLSHSAKNP